LPHLYQTQPFGLGVSTTTTRARTQGKPLENKRLKVSYARPSSSDIQHANLYVSKLDPSVTKEKMDEIFAPYGTIIDSKILVGNYLTRMPPRALCPHKRTHETHTHTLTHTPRTRTTHRPSHGPEPRSGLRAV
jgi:hypothetical protein